MTPDGLALAVHSLVAMIPVFLPPLAVVIVIGVLVYRDRRSGRGDRDEP